jgi:hypothetical protein
VAIDLRQETPRVCRMLNCFCAFIQETAFAERLQPTSPRKTRTHTDDFRRSILAANFNKEELQELVRALGADPGSFEGSKSTIAHELVGFLSRRGFGLQLLQAVRAKRPYLDLTPHSISPCARPSPTRKSGSGTRS